MKYWADIDSSDNRLNSLRNGFESNGKFYGKDFHAKSVYLKNSVENMVEWKWRSLWKVVYKLRDGCESSDEFWEHTRIQLRFPRDSSLGMGILFTWTRLSKILRLSSEEVRGIRRFRISLEHYLHLWDSYSPIFFTKWRHILHIKNALKLLHKRFLAKFLL